MAVTQFFATPAWTRPVTLHLFRCQAVEIGCHHPKVGCPEQLPIKLENAFCSVCPLAEWPRFPLLDHSLCEKETVERAIEEFQQRAARWPQTPSLVGKQHAGRSIDNVHVAIITHGDAAAGLADDG